MGEGWGFFLVGDKTAPFATETVHSRDGFVNTRLKRHFSRVVSYFWKMRTGSVDGFNLQTSNFKESQIPLSFT